MVEELASLGAYVFTCSRNAEELERCLKEWSAKGFRVTGIVCDVSVKSEREKLMEQVGVSFAGRLNIFVRELSPLQFLCLYERIRELNYWCVVSLWN